MIQKDSFYYIPDLMPWSPTSVERNLPLDTMLEVAKMGQEQVDKQLLALSKLKAGVHGIDAMLDQDVFYKTQKMSEIAEKSKEFANKNLLDRSVQTDLFNYVDGISYDTNLETIANRTKTIRDSYKTYYDLFAKGETSESNIYPMLQSIDEANKKFKETNSFDPLLKVDARLRPFVDVGKTMLEGIDKVDVSSMPFPDGKDFRVTDLGNGYQQILTLEGKSKEALMEAAQTALGEKGMTQLYLDYQYKNSLTEGGLKDDKGNPLSFEKYAGEVLLNAGEAFQTRVLKRDNPMVNLYEQRKFEMAKLQKQFENDRTIAKMRIDADIKLEKEKQKREGKISGSEFAVIPSNPTSIGEFIGDFVRTKEDYDAAQTQLEKFTYGHNLNILPDKMMELKENFDNSKYTVPEGVSAEDAEKIYSIFRDQNEGSYLSILTDNYINAKSKRKDWADLSGDETKLMEAYEAAKQIAEQNKRNANTPWFSSDTVAGYKDNYLNTSKFRAFFNTVGNPDGMTAEEVLTNTMLKGQGNSWFDGFVNKVRGADGQIKAKLGSTTINYAMVPTDSDSPSSKLSTQMTKSVNIRALNSNGFPVTTFKSNTGGDVAITNKTKPTNFTLISSGSKPYLQIEVSDGEVTGTLYADVPTSFETTYKELAVHSLLIESKKDAPNMAAITAATNAISSFDKSFSINLLNAKDYSKMPTERTRVIIGDNVSTQNIIPTGAEFKEYTNDGRVVKCNIYAVPITGGGERYFIGYKANQAEGGANNTVFALSFNPNYSPAEKDSGNVYFPDMQSAVNAATILKYSD